MTDPVLERLLAAVVADPDDDVPRLAYADRIEETGADDARAEFIRLGVRRAALAGCGAGDGGAFCPAGACHYCYLLRREEDFLVGHWTAWAGGWPGVAYFSVDATGRRIFARSVGGHLIRLHFRRGFVAGVTLPCAAWQRHGPALVRAAPLEVVRLADKDPTGYPAVSGLQNHWRWFDGSRAGGPDSCDPDELPSALWPFYAAEMARRGTAWDHPGRADAESCLSAACLAWARACAPAGAQA